MAAPSLNRSEPFVVRGVVTVVRRLETGVLTVAEGDEEPPRVSATPPEDVGVRGVTGLFTGELFQAGLGMADAATREFCHFLLALLGELYGEVVVLPFRPGDFGGGLEEEEIALDDDAAGTGAGMESARGKGLFPFS